MEIKLNQTFWNRGNQYVVKGFPTIYASAHFDGVLYQLNNESEEQEPQFVISSVAFQHAFIPVNLDMGMMIAEIKNRTELVKRFTVTAVDLENQTVTAIADSQTGPRVFKIKTDSNGVVHPVDEMDTTVYYYDIFQLTHRLVNSQTIKNIVENLNQGSLRAGAIDPMVSADDLEETQNSVLQTLQIMYAKYGI